MGRTAKGKRIHPAYMAVEGGGVTSAAGFRASGIHAGFKKKPDVLDFAVVVSDEACPAAAVFTKNIFCAAPVMVSREHLFEESSGQAKAVIINSGNANAATGEPGVETARSVCKEAASLLGCSAEDILVASTGVIGVPLAMDAFAESLPVAIGRVSTDGGHEAAEAIMTTDTLPKECAFSYASQDPAYEGAVFTVGGMVKGSGMIMPDMATLIAVVTTDAPVSPQGAHRALVDAVEASFNKVTIDSDTSTNDTCILMASGKAAGPEQAYPVFPFESLAFEEFSAVLEAVCVELARKVAADGEGATKLITVTVKGARNDVDADCAARAIANSPLVKTAVFGHDANWGRVAMAIGKSGAVFRQEKVSIDFVGLPVCRHGLPVPFDEDEVLRRFEKPEVAISVDLGAGHATTTMWTCDYSHDYITINGDYRT